MRPVTRRQTLRLAACWAAVLGLGRGGAQQPAPRVVRLVAQRFKYTPNEIPLKVGEPVVLEVQSLDFVHGLNIPDFGQRADLVPGRITRLELLPHAPGIVEFVCDNFCGDEHEAMHGRFVVTA